MEPHIIYIETATQSCSIALGRGDQIVAIRESREKNAHARNVTVFIDEVLKEAGIEKETLNAVAVSRGPGSYTGLRIGTSTAKGLCYALNISLIAIGTLQAMAAGMADEKLQKAIYCPMIDARRMEVYAALFDENNNRIRETKAEIIQEDSFAEYLKDHKVIFFGDGAPKCKAVLGDHPNAEFVDDFYPSSKHMLKIATEKFRNQEFEDMAYFEPFYLKDFIAGKPRVKGLK